MIIASIEEYLKDGGQQKNVLLLTENLSDFACARTLSKKEASLLPLDDQYGLPNVYVARSAAVLFGALSSNVGPASSCGVADIFNERLVKAIKSRISYTDAEILLDMFSSFLDVRIEQETIFCNVIESRIRVDLDTGVMEAKGIIKVTFSCSFTVDNLDIQLNIVDDQFVFMKQVKDRAFQERLPWRGEWAEDFSNMEYAKEFLFEYIDFDYIEGDESTPRELDTLYLSFSRL